MRVIIVVRGANVCVYRISSTQNEARIENYNDQTASMMGEDVNERRRSVADSRCDRRSLSIYLAGSIRLCWLVGWLHNDTYNQFVGALLVRGLFPLRRFETRRKTSQSRNKIDRSLSRAGASQESVPTRARYVRSYANTRMIIEAKSAPVSARSTT